MVPEEAENPSDQADHPLAASARIRFFIWQRLMPLGGGAAGRERYVAPVGVINVRVVFDSEGGTMSKGLFSLITPPPGLGAGMLMDVDDVFLACLTRSKKPIGSVNTPLFGLESGRAVGGDGGVVEPGVLGMDSFVFRRLRGGWVWLDEAGIMSWVSMRESSSKKERSSWARASRLEGAQTGKGHVVDSRCVNEAAEGMTRCWRELVLSLVLGVVGGNKGVHDVEGVGREGPSEGGERRVAAPKSTYGPATSIILHCLLSSFMGAGEYACTLFPL